MLPARLVQTRTTRLEGRGRDIVVTAIWVSMAALAAFAAGLFGLWLQRLLPKPHTSDRSRDMITAIVGLVSLLLALVLGTIIGSAYAFYSNQKTELETIAARALPSVTISWGGPYLFMIRLSNLSAAACLAWP
jgi:uncharacterized membrane protein SpoIIM required for sporulation